MTVSLLTRRLFSFPPLASDLSLDMITGSEKVQIPRPIFHPSAKLPTPPSLHPSTPPWEADNRFSEAVHTPPTSLLPPPSSRPPHPGRLISSHSEDDVFRHQSEWLTDSILPLPTSISPSHTLLQYRPVTDTPQGKAGSPPPIKSTQYSLLLSIPSQTLTLRKVVFYSSECSQKKRHYLRQWNRNIWKIYLDFWCKMKIIQCTVSSLSDIHWSDC